MREARIKLSDNLARWCARITVEEIVRRIAPNSLGETAYLVLTRSPLSTAAQTVKQKTAYF
jgi:hypothetical protein